MPVFSNLCGPVFKCQNAAAKIQHSNFFHGFELNFNFTFSSRHTNLAQAYRMAAKSTQGQKQLQMTVLIERNGKLNDSKMDL